MNMVVANDMSDQPFSLFHFDGILGLGLEALSLGPGFSFFGQMAAELPMQSRFSVFLARSDQGQSSISFGGHDESKAASGFSWVPVAKPELGYWQVQVYQVRIGDAVLDECADGGRQLGGATELLMVRSTERRKCRLPASPRAGPR